MLLYYLGTGRDKSVLLVSLVWLIAIGIIADNGFFENTSVMPPRFALVIGGAILLCIYFYRISGKAKLNINYLFAIHTLRVPVELGLYQLYLQKKVPVLMTYEGWNYDIATGISAVAILVYLVLAKRKLHAKFMLWWNIIGLVLLTIIVVIAILSSPLPFQVFAFNQPNIAVLQFPFVFLPAYIVPVVLLSHLLLLRSRQGFNDPMPASSKAK